MDCRGPINKFRTAVVSIHLTLNNCILLKGKRFSIHVLIYFARDTKRNEINYMSIYGL
jgi:hypothetical protein